MIKLYYRIWVDAIVAEQSKKVERKNWKFYSLIPISIIQGFNLLTFFYWMKIIVNRNLPLFFGINIFNARLVNSFISVVVTFIVPFVILNYLLIFSNDQYKELIIKYKSENGKLYKKYVLYSLGIFAIPIAIKTMFF